MADATARLGRPRVHRIVSRLVPALVAMVVLTAVAVGCGSSSHNAAPTTVPIDQSCPLSQAQVEDLLGTGAVAVEPPPLGSAVTAPRQRCQYQVGSSTAQVSLFEGTGMATQLKSILGKAEPAPEVGPGAYCDAHQGTTDASLSCVFLANGNTVVLSVDVPNADLTTDLQAKVRTLASVLANKV